MPRLGRSVFARVPHHITQRGYRRDPVFFSDEDRHAYLALLSEYAGKNEVEILAYCLIPNHGIRGQEYEGQVWTRSIQSFF
jgi:putative transposase